MDNQTPKNSGVSLLVAFLIFFVTAIVFFYVGKVSTEFAYEKKLEDQEAVLEAVLDSEKNLQTCLTDAFKTYEGDWQTACDANNLGVKCTLPLSVSNSVNDGYQKQQDRCYSRY